MPRVSRKQAELNHERLIEVASVLLRERGISGLSLTDVMNQLGMTVGGFYKHFNSKESLVEAAFGRALGHVEASRDETLDSIAEYHEAVSEIVRRYLEDSSPDSAGSGCPLAALAGDVARESPNSGVRFLFNEGVEDFAAALSYKHPRGRSRKHQHAKALTAIATLAGGLMLARALPMGELRSELIEATGRGAVDALK